MERIRDHEAHIRCFKRELEARKARQPPRHGEREKIGPQIIELERTPRISRKFNMPTIMTNYGTRDQVNHVGCSPMPSCYSQ